MRYFFHAPSARDDEGQEMTTIAAARRHAISYLCALMVDDPVILANGDDLEIKVTDASGLSLFTVVAICIEAPTLTQTMGRV